MSNVGSIFSGIGGLDYGLELAGHRVRWQCENDKFRRALLNERFRGVRCFHDVREITRRTPHVDILAGGFPCQDLSVGGRRAGFSGQRSSLFFEFARVAEILTPKWILIENVPGFISSQDGRDFGLALETLAQLGYGVAWRILDSRYFGVPQRRRRLFLLGNFTEGDTRAAAKRAAQVLSVGSRCERHPPSRRAPSENVSNTVAGRPAGGGRNTDIDGSSYFVEDFENGTLTGGMGRVDRRPLLTGKAASVRRLMPIECERLQGFPDNWTQLEKTPDSRRYSGLGDAVTVNVANWIGRRLVFQQRRSEETWEPDQPIRAKANLRRKIRAKAKLK